MCFSLSVTVYASPFPVFPFVHPMFFPLFPSKCFPPSFSSLLPSAWFLSMLSLPVSFYLFFSHCFGLCISYFCVSSLFPHVCLSRFPSLCSLTVFIPVFHRCFPSACFSLCYPPPPVFFYVFYLPVSFHLTPPCVIPVFHPYGS